MLTNSVQFLAPTPKALIFPFFETNQGNDAMMGVMNALSLSKESLRVLRTMQQQETDTHALYTRIAAGVKGPNRTVLERLADDEARHAVVWQRYTGRQCRPRRLRVFIMTLVNRLLGFTFTVKFLEGREDRDGAIYAVLEAEIPEAKQIREDEDAHEKALMDVLDEERLKYVGSMVLGMNDALVELTGALVGFTFALQQLRLVALAGLITGVSATLSMTASSYLSAKADGETDALKSSFYTGAMYLLTVALMVTPFLLFPPHMPIVALCSMFAVVVGIIFIFNFYISVAKDLSFKRRFTEMLVLCILVTGVSFGIGSLLKLFLGSEIS